MRDINRRAVLSHIRHNGRNSRLKIGKALGLSAAAMTSVVNQLLKDGLLKNHAELKPVTTPEIKQQGRPISLLELQGDAAYVLGIVLRPVGNLCLIEKAWADYSGQITTLTATTHYNSNNLNSIIDGVKKTVSELVQSVPETTRIYGLTIGIPGVVEHDTIPIAPKLTCIQGTAFIQQIREAIPYPISFQNDVNLGALSELHQQPRLRKQSYAYLHVYSGVGSGIVLKGDLLNGASGWAGEIGQLRLHRNGTQATSFEECLSIDGALADLLEKLNHPRDALDELIPYIENKNSLVLKTINQYARSLCELINVIHCVLDLDEIMIDFPSSSLLKHLLSRIKQNISTMPHKPRITTPSIEAQADLHGAALFALDTALEEIERITPLTGRQPSIG